MIRKIWMILSLFLLDVKCKTFKESLPVHYLNEKGLLPKEILWMINNTYANIEYSPIIIQLIKYNFNFL